MCRNRRLSFGGGGGLRRASKREAGDLPQVLCEEGRGGGRPRSYIHRRAGRQAGVQDPPNDSMPLGVGTLMFV